MYKTAPDWNVHPPERGTLQMPYEPGFYKSAKAECAAMRAMRDGPKTLTELEALIPASRQTIYRGLKGLERDEQVTRERLGKTDYWCLA